MRHVFEKLFELRGLPKRRNFSAADFGGGGSDERDDCVSDIRAIAEVTVELLQRLSKLKLLESLLEPFLKMLGQAGLQLSDAELLSDEDEVDAVFGSIGLGQVFAVEEVDGRLDGSFAGGDSGDDRLRRLDYFGIRILCAVSNDYGRSFPLALTCIRCEAQKAEPVARVALSAVSVNVLLLNLIVTLARPSSRRVLRLVSDVFSQAVTACAHTSGGRFARFDPLRLTW